MDRFFQVIIDGQEMLLNGQQLQSIYRNLNLPITEIPTQIINCDNTINFTTDKKNLDIETTPQKEM